MRNVSALRVVLILAILLLSVILPAFAEQPGTASLTIRMLYPGMVQLDGDIHVDDRIELYRREYRSADQTLSDQLLAEANAGTDRSVTVSYGLYSEPLAVKQLTPDFEYQGKEIELRALYAVVSNGEAELRSELL